MSTVSPTISTPRVRTLDDMQTAQRTTKKELGQDQFMELLVQQLANQDPLSPASDTDFIAQLAQFSSLNQLTTLSNSMVQQQMYSLVGKYVYVYADSSQENIAIGKVDSVVNQGGKSYLLIGEDSFELSDILGVVNMDESPKALNQNVINSTGLFGKNVTAGIKNDDGTVTEISGTVIKLSTKDGIAYATIQTAETGDREVAVSGIEEIYS